MDSYTKKMKYSLHLSGCRCRVVQAHWDQMEEMETLFRREGTLLYQQPDMVRILKATVDGVAYHVLYI